MMYNPEDKKKEEVAVTAGAEPEKHSWDFLKESSLYERWMRIKQRILLRREERAKKKNAGAMLVH